MSECGGIIIGFYIVIIRWITEEGHGDIDVANELWSIGGT